MVLRSCHYSSIKSISEYRLLTERSNSEFGLPVTEAVSMVKFSF